MNARPVYIREVSGSDTFLVTQCIVTREPMAREMRPFSKNRQGDFFALPNFLILRGTSEGLTIHTLILTHSPVQTMHTGA